MYRYSGFNKATGNGISRSGTFVQCLKWAKRYYQRMGFEFDITRPDGTSIRDVARIVG